MKEIYIENNSLPLSVIRSFLKQVLSDEELGKFRLALRPIFHTDAPNNSSLSDLQTIREQIRFYTKHRCIRDFRLVALHLKERFPEGFKVIINQSSPISNSDFDFFDVISQYIPLNLVLNYSKFYHINDEDNDITRIRRGLVSSDDWQWLHNTLSRLLNYGDSWTAVWLSQIVLKSHNNIPPYFG